MLGLASVAGVKGQTAKLEGDEIAREREQATLLERLKQQREAEELALRERLTNAQIANLESQANTRGLPSPSPSARAQYDPARGGWVLPPDEQNPTGRFVEPEGIVPRPEPPRAPVRGTPEYNQTIADEARARAEAAAQVPTGTERARVEQQRRAFANVKSALDRFEQGVEQGIRLMPGQQKSALETEYEGLQLQLKELFNLGVLNGPDLELMRRIINNPSGLYLNAQRALGVKPEEVLRAQIQRVRLMIDDYERNLDPTTQRQSSAPSAIINRYQLEVPE